MENIVNNTPWLKFVRVLITFVHASCVLCPLSRPQLEQNQNIDVLTLSFHII